jgi:hypothetical protein
MAGNRGSTNWTEHIARSKQDDDHHGANVDAIHLHQPYAKYVFAPSPYFDGAYVHDHGTSWKRTAADKREERRRLHVVKMHEGVEAAGAHSHEWRIKDLSVPMARRLDVHPMSVERLGKSAVVFFVIEGCIKADAVLADGGAVFSVPSVSLWDADELGRFCDEYLFDKVVVIVADADWRSNDHVINQARLCQNKLRQLAVKEVHVAAPPTTFKGRKTKGVDDFLGAGGHLEDLLVVDSDPPGELYEFVASRWEWRRDKTRRAAEVLMAISNYTGNRGVLVAPLRTVARVMGTSPMRVSRAVADLVAMDAVTIAGDLSSKRGWFSGQWEWKNRPGITLIPELRSYERPLKGLVT